MSDLISRSALLKYMETTEISQYIDELNKGNDNYNSTPLYDFVEEMPTAYDVDKVMEQLEEYRAKFDCVSCKYFDDVEGTCDKDCTDALIDGLIDIIRAGGKE